MNENKKAEVDTDAILMTLDQIGQTIDVMTSVVGRLRGYITEQQEQEQTPASSQERAALKAFNSAHADTAQVLH